MKNLTINLKLRPFPVPNEIYVELPPIMKKEPFQLFQNQNAIKLGSVSKETLEAMIEEFRVSVLTKAGYDTERTIKEVEGAENLVDEAPKRAPSIR